MLDPRFAHPAATLQCLICRLASLGLFEGKELSNQELHELVLFLWTRSVNIRAN